MKLIVLALCAWVVYADAGKIGGRIIGGLPANAGQFPFVAAIYKDTALGRYFCTGTLFKSQWIITAAQCVTDATLFTIRLGSNSLNTNDANTQLLSTDTYLAHPDYNPDSLENDIGVIRLRLPVTFNDYIRPINTLGIHPLPDYASVVTVGWGQTSDSTPGTVDRLNYVYLTTLSNEECKLAYGNGIADTVVCVEGNYNQGTCRGDLGSPLLQFGGSSLSYLVGISSFISANGCESTDPSGFTRTDPFVDWLNNVTAS